MSGLSDYDYDLPPELIAQEPTARRDESRLLVLHKATGSWKHHTFRDIQQYVGQGDLLVLNETRVFPARLRALKPTGGRVEILLLEQAGSSSSWRALARPARALKEGVELQLAEAAVTLRPLGREDDKVIIEFHRGEKRLEADEVVKVCEEVGEVPLPPYIQRDGGRDRRVLDRERYQTVFAKTTGAVAAPTAGLHFTARLLEELADRGVEIARITLHVGYGTFKPLTEEVLQGSTLHSEWVEVPEKAGRAILDARRDDRRIIAVGTTSLRGVESFLASGKLPFRGSTDLFVKPGYSFRGVSSLVTNFHLPRSSLLLLVSALAGRERVLAAYGEAIQTGYRFYSYGDAMLIL